MTEQLLAYTPPEPGRARLRARVTTGDRSDWRTLMLIVEPSQEAPSVEGSPTIDGGAADEPGSAAGPNRLRPILQGVMTVSGAVFVLGLGLLILRGRRKT